MLIFVSSLQTQSNFIFYLLAKLNLMVSAARCSFVHTAGVIQYATVPFMCICYCNIPRAHGTARNQYISTLRQHTFPGHSFHGLSPPNSILHLSPPQSIIIASINSPLARQTHLNRINSQQRHFDRCKLAFKGNTVTPNPRQKRYSDYSLQCYLSIVKTT